MADPSSPTVGASTGPDPKVAAKQLQERVKRRADADEALRAEAKKNKGLLHRVAEGKSVTCARGVVGPDEPVTARDFCKRADDIEDGKKQLEKMIELGYVTPAKKAAKEVDETKK